MFEVGQLELCRDADVLQDLGFGNLAGLALPEALGLWDSRAFCHGYG